MLQQQDILGASQLNTSKQVASYKVAKSMDDSIVADSEVTWLADFLLSVSIGDISENDANIAFYVCGYIGHSITCWRECSSCKTMLVKSKDIPPPPQCESNENAKFFELANRGGLSIQTEFCFAITSLAI